MQNDYFIIQYYFQRKLKAAESNIEETINKIFSKVSNPARHHHYKKIDEKKRYFSMEEIFPFLYDW